MQPNKNPVYHRFGLNEEHTEIKADGRKTPNPEQPGTNK